MGNFFSGCIQEKKEKELDRQSYNKNNIYNLKSLNGKELSFDNIQIKEEISFDNILNKRKRNPFNIKLEYESKERNKSYSKNVSYFLLDDILFDNFDFPYNINNIINEKEYKKIYNDFQGKSIKEILNEINNRFLEMKINNEEENNKIISIENEAKKKKYYKFSLDEKKVKLLEDMCAMGTIMKEEIIIEKMKNPDKFYTKEEIIKNKSNEQLYCLGIFSQILENLGMTVAILKDDSKESINSSQTLLQFIANGVFNKPKYNFHFNMKKEIIEILLNNKYKREMFHNKLKKIISKEYYIDEEEIIITYPRKGSYIVSLIFKSIDFELNERELLRKFENYKEELGVLKKIEKTIILDGCKLTVSMLDVRGNNKDPGWAKIGEKRVVKIIYHL